MGQWKMRQRLKEQLTDGVEWVKEWAKNNPLGALVVTVFAVWFFVTLVLTELSDRWGFAPKTFWDWLDLLIVPLVLALGALWFNASQKRTEIAIANDKQRQDILLDYFDEMTALLLREHIVGFSKLAKAIAKARTLAVLRVLDPERVAAVLRFHVEARLAEAVPLAGGNLSGVDWQRARLHDVDLHGIDLGRANLNGAYLNRANLGGAYLRGANLNGTNLSRANLREAYLSGADLSGADLSGADLSHAYLREANLNGANLSGARVLTAEELLQAKSLKNATMPDGTKYEEWIKKQETQQPQAETDNHDVEKEEEE